MIDGSFVFDNAIHVYDLSDDNLRFETPDAAFTRDQLLGLSARGPPVFGDGVTDMAMAQVVPLFD